MYTNSDVGIHTQPVLILAEAKGRRLKVYISV